LFFPERCALFFDFRVKKTRREINKNKPDNQIARLVRCCNAVWRNLKQDGGSMVKHVQDPLVLLEVLDGGAWASCKLFHHFQPCIIFRSARPVLDDEVLDSRQRARSDRVVNGSVSASHLNQRCHIGNGSRVLLFHPKIFIPSVASDAVPEA
jgi:hypothetical protein